MKVLVSINGRDGELKLRQDGANYQFEYSPMGCEQYEAEASLIEAEPGIYSVLIDGRSYDVKVVQGPNGLYIDLRGRRSVVEIRDPRTMTRRGRAGLGESRQTITAPMPGKIVRVLVKPGDAVEAGAGLVVVEAMKMQNELKATKPGRVLQVSAKQGDAVAGGEALVVIE
jgi:acetyl/propionyl-CoA carboxylase alpha subunit